MTTEDSYYIEGIAKVEDQLLILLDLDRALDSESIQIAAAAAA